MSLMGRLRAFRRHCTRSLNHWRARRSGTRLGNGVKINRYSVFTPGTRIAEFSNFNGMTVTGKGEVRIGRYFHSGENCRIITSFHNFDKGSAIPYGPGSEDTHKPVEIGDFVWFGDNVIVLGGVKIGEGAIIQAGSTVVSNVPDLAIAGGHPARVFAQRDADHFYRLRDAGCFH